MNYSQVGIANVALSRIGARGQISSINDNSPNAIKVLAVWDTVFQEVLAERDWRFAKTRAALTLTNTCSFTGSISSNTLTVTAVSSGTIFLGQTVLGTGVLPCTIVSAFVSGTGGTGTYTVTQAQNVGSESMTARATPLYGYQYAWTLPGDLLRFVRPHKVPPDRFNWWFGFGPEGDGWYSHRDPPFWPNGWPYIVEQIPTSVNDGVTTYTRCALTNYGGFCGPAMINYIQLITDLTQLTPGFVNSLQWRLGKELAIPVTEDKQKFELCENQYKQSLNSAEAQNECLDYSAHEAGSESWVRAGRCADVR